ncbi:MAG: bifunctional nicotinamidase/pyrazinamidase [Gemmatimonadota bacterium]
MDTLHPGNTALLLVDIQPDFLPGGALEVGDGDAILQPVTRLMESGRFPLQVATQDWHPAGHVSFSSVHSGKDPFATMELHGHEQVLWPDHCVQGTPGAELDPRLPWQRVSAVIRKGMDPQVDSYSGFRNNWDAQGRRPTTGLAGFLKERGVDTVVVCGLARDYCVQWTAQDAAEAGFRTILLWDLTRAVDPGSDDAVREALEERGVEVVSAWAG